MALRPDAERDRRGLMERCRKNSTVEIQARERELKERRSVKNRLGMRSFHLCARGASSLFSDTGSRPLPCTRNAEATDSSLLASRRSSSCRWLDTGLLCGERPRKRLRRYGPVNEEQEGKGVGKADGGQSDIEALYRVFPQLSFSGELQKLNGRVTFSTLPTGQVNARTLIVPHTNTYLIVFDPAFFDFLYSISNNFAQAIDPKKAQEGAKQYAVSGREMPLSKAIHYGDPTVTESFFSTLSAFLGWGLPPPLHPYDEEIFSLAEHLRQTGALFIAAHEYSHILLGHVQPSNANEGRSRHDGPESKTWKQELDADWLACGILDAVLTARRLPPPVRFMGVHFFFISAMIVDLALTALQSGQSQQLMNLIKSAEQQPGTTHPVPVLRGANVNLWLQKKYPPLEYRATQYFAALLLQVADSLWVNVEPHVLIMRSKGFNPPVNWTGFDVFEHD